MKNHSDAGRHDDPPALVVEVRSPGTWRFDVGRKRAVYERSGVRELRLVDTPASTVLVYRRRTADSTGFGDAAEVGPGAVLVSPVLEGFGRSVPEQLVDGVLRTAIGRRRRLRRPGHLGRRGVGAGARR